jgi:hypothetical protein
MASFTFGLERLGLLMAMVRNFKARKALPAHKARKALRAMMLTL